MSVAILVPVLARPHRVKPLLASIAAATPRPYRVLFLADREDHDEHDAVRAAGGELVVATGNYAAKINRGVRETTEPLIFFAADDLEFRPGWLQAALGRLDSGVQVVGVNDLIERRPGRAGHATHFLVTRGYAELPTIDEQPGPMCELYDHSWVDNEFIATAARRGAYAYAPDSHVAHLHPMNGTAEDDETYRRGRRLFRQDRRIFLGRSAMWT